MDAIIEILTQILAVLGLIYTGVRAIVASTKTPVEPATSKPDADLMVEKKPLVALIGKLFGIDLTQGRSENPGKRPKSKTKKKLPPTML